MTTEYLLLVCCRVWGGAGGRSTPAGFAGEGLQRFEADEGFWGVSSAADDAPKFPFC